MPDYGVITRLGAPIFDLQGQNYEIKTEKAGRDTIYKLVALPKGGN